MAKLPLTRETAKVGEEFQSADGRRMRKILSPYDPQGKETTVIALGPEAKTAKASAPAVKAKEAAPPAQIIQQAPIEQMAAPPTNPIERAIMSVIATPAYGAPLAEQEDRNSGLGLADLIDPERAYTKRVEQRDKAAADDEEQAIHDEAGFWEKAAAVGKDIGKGVFVEGIPAAAGGIKKAFNSTMDLAESLADELPGPVISWGDIDNNPETPNGLRMEFGKGKDLKAKGLMTRVLPQLNLGEGEKPETNTGKLVQGTSQFIAGLVGAGKLTKGWVAATRAGKIAKAMVNGAIADFAAFDGQEERLSNLLAEIGPEASKPVFEYLSAHEDDPELLGRAKNVIEGAGLGVVAETIGHGLRMMRASRKVKAEAKRAAAAEGMQVPIDLTPDELAKQATETVAQFEKLQTAKPSFAAKVAEARKTTGKDKAKPVAAELVSADPGDNVFNLKLGTMETADDIKAVVVKAAKKYETDVDAARRGVRTWDQTGAAADSLDWVQSMASRRKGDAVNAETILAYREVLNGSAQKLMSLAREVKTAPTVANQAAFREALATHHAIQLEFMGARAEAGRALNAFKIPAGAPAQRLRQMDAALVEAGGLSVSQDLANAVLKAAQKGGDKGLGQFVAGGWQAKSRDMIKFVYTNGLMSGFGTPGANTIGNATATLGSVLNRAVAPRLARLAGGMSETEVGEASAMLAGHFGAMKDLLQTGVGDFTTNFNWDRIREKGVLSAAVPEDLLPEGLAKTGREETNRNAGGWYPDEDTQLGRALDATGVILKTAVGTPSDLNAATDGVFRIIAARGALRAEAFRIATKEARARGLPKADMQKRMAELIQEPTPDMLAVAEREMQELTFSRNPERGSFADKWESLRRRLDEGSGPIPMGTIVFPFIRTPTNIISTAMRYSPLAPKMQRYVEEINAGGARAELAKAQMAVGTAVMAVMYDMAANGDLTGNGPKNKAQRDALMRQDENGTSAWQPYSVRLTVGDKQYWVDMNRIEPLATTMALVADYAEIMHNNDWDDAKTEQMSEISAHMSGALGQAAFNKTMLTSLMEWGNAFSGTDPARAQRFYDGLPDKFIPMSGLRRSMRKSVDPYMRDTSSALDAIMNNVPGLSDDLPIARDLWGAPKTYQSGLGTVYDVVSPIKVREAGGTAIDQEILRLAVPVAMPQKSLSVNGKQVSLKNRLDIYNELVEAAGRPAFLHLEAVVNGEHPDSAAYFEMTDGIDGEKSVYIEKVVSAYRKAAAAEVSARYHDELADIAAAHDLAKIRASGQ